MQRKGIERRNIVRQNSMPRDLPRFRDQIESRGRQRRHVQRLANVTRSLRSAGVLVDKSAASSEIEQRKAAYNGERAPAGDEPDGIHLLKAVHLSVALRRANGPLGC